MSISVEKKCKMDNKIELQWFIMEVLLPISVLPDISYLDINRLKRGRISFHCLA